MAAGKGGGSTVAPAGLNLLLCEAEEREPVLQRELDTDSAQNQERLRKAHLPKNLWSDGGDQNSLPEQRWGVIVPEGSEGDRLLDLIAPLVKHRRAQQEDAPVEVYRAPAKADQAEAMEWRKKIFDAGTDTREDLPRYQLILGNLDQVALAIQQVQSIDSYVGRLAFDNLEHYRSYAEKVLRYENGAQQSEPSRASFFTVHDGTEATAAGYRSLVNPGVTLAQRKVMERKLAAREIVDLGDKVIPSREDLLERVSARDPSVLFTLSHGAGAPRAGWKSAADQQQRQGAMSFGSDGLLTGRDLTGRPFLPGGIWFMLACYGAGTPDTSAYRHWLESLSQINEFEGPATAVLKGLPKAGERPFIAAIPQAVLHNPEGPLAFLGHIDLAWTYSFTELDSGSAMDRPGKFIQIVADLLKGNRVGIALRSLMLALGSANTELTTLYDRQASAGNAPLSPAGEARRGHLWMLRQDLASYIVLGDPAARLPLASGSAPGVKPVAAPSATASAAAMLFGSSVMPPVASLSIEQLELAIVQAIVAPQRLEQIAMEAGISSGELRAQSERYRQAGRAALKLSR